MGKKTRNKEILGLLNSKNKEKICQFAKENKLIRNEAPFCDNQKCPGFSKRRATWCERKSTADGFSWRCTLFTFRLTRN